MENAKLVLSYLISPFSLGLIAIAAAWIAKFRQKEKLSVRLWATATVLLTLGSLSVLTYEQRRSNEYSYPPLALDSNELLKRSPILAVVLGAGFNADELLPPNSRVSGSYLARLLEAVRIYRDCPNATLVISVAGKAEATQKQLFVDSMAKLLDLDSVRVRLISDAESTADEAETIKSMHQGEQIIVVTSAGHMPRAMSIFEDQDLPLHAADYGFTRAASPNDKPWQRWIPSPDGISSNQQFLYESVAGLWHIISSH